MNDKEIHVITPNTLLLLDNGDIGTPVCRFVGTLKEINEIFGNNISFRYIYSKNINDVYNRDTLKIVKIIKPICKLKKL